MEIILLQDVNKLGQKDDLVKVKDGYGRNFLIPSGYAVAATSSAKKMHLKISSRELIKKRKSKLKHRILLRNWPVLNLLLVQKQVLQARYSDQSILFRLLNHLRKKDLKLTARSITLPEDQIKEIGKYKAVVKLHREVKVEIDFEIVGE